MINHPLTVLPRTPPPFAKLGLIRPNPPVHVFSFSAGETGRVWVGRDSTCQVEWRQRRRRRLQQPVLIRYQISEVSGSRRPGAALLLLRHVASVSRRPPLGLGRPGVELGRRSASVTRHITSRVSWRLGEPLPANGERRRINRCSMTTADAPAAAWKIFYNKKYNPTLCGVLPCGCMGSLPFY